MLESKAERGAVRIKLGVPSRLGAEILLVVVFIVCVAPFLQLILRINFRSWGSFGETFRVFRLALLTVREGNLS